MKVVIPMAGRGLRLKSSIPKPLIDILGKPMIQYAVETLDIPGQYIFVIRKYEDEKINLKLQNILRKITRYPIILPIDYVTEGPACSALIAKEFINNEESLIITNCDQILTWNANKFLDYYSNNDFDGIVVTYNCVNEKNSYIKLDSDGNGIELAEKKIISDYSLNGIHFWKHGYDFISSAEEMIAKNLRTNNEFYIAPTYNILINRGKKIRAYNIPANEHWAVGTQEDLERYIKYAQI